MKKQPTTIGRSIDQNDHNSYFDGDNNNYKPAKESTKYTGNQHAGRQDVNKTRDFGRGPTVGNTGSFANKGPKLAPDTRKVPAFEAAGKRLHDGTFNAGAQVRNPGGTRKWEPKSENNYIGNPDMRNEGRGPTKGSEQ